SSVTPLIHTVRLTPPTMTTANRTSCQSSVSSSIGALMLFLGTHRRPSGGLDAGQRSSRCSLDRRLREVGRLRGERDDPLDLLDGRGLLVDVVDHRGERVDRLLVAGRLLVEGDDDRLQGEIREAILEAQEAPRLVSGGVDGEIVDAGGETRQALRELVRVL